MNSRPRERAWVGWRSFEINEYEIQMESRIDRGTYANEFNVAK
jgi:hypothetical protein